MKSDSAATTRGGGRLLNAAGVLIGAIAMSAAGLPRAHSAVDPATVDTGHPTGHVHDHGDETWPPQPRGITNVVTLSNAREEELAAATQERLAARQERIAMARAEVRQALGGHFVRVAIINEENKSGATGISRLVYFSHAKNATVEVTVDGQRVRGVKTIPAAEYQPEITDTEIADAEGIARAHFTALGQDRVAQLQAFGILAYLPTGKGFYATRVLYISFHRDSDAPPEYVAWVDLTQRRVLRARQEGQ